MPKKKGNGEKSSKTRDKFGAQMIEDVKVFTSLPPQVDGQLRCFCKVAVEEIIWSTDIPNPPVLTLVRTKWWGEDGEGSTFKPVDVLQQGRTTFCTTARYPIRSGLKQFTSYLNDMGCLTLEVLSGPMAIAVGTAEITEISSLSNMKPISGLIPVFNPEDQQIAELKVSIVIEPLMASYDSMGSIPTTDISMEMHVTQESALPHRVLPEPHSHLPPKPDDDLFVSPASHLNDDSQRVENGISLRYADDLRQTLNYDLPDVKVKDIAPVTNGSTVSITENGEVVTTRDKFSPPTKHLVHSVDSGFNSVRDVRRSAEGSDVLSVLLNRGNKLRDAMIVSTLPPTKSTSQPDNLNNIHDTSFRHSTGNLYKDYTSQRDIVPSSSSNTDTGVKAVDLVLHSPVRSRDFQSLNLETPDATLILDYQHFALSESTLFVNMMLEMVNSNRSPGSSLSSDPEILSDSHDPLQEDDIINELFYKYSDSEGSALSDFSPEEPVRAARSRSRSGGRSRSEAKSRSGARSRSRSNSTGRSRSRSNSASSLKDAGNMRPPSRRSSISTLSNIPVLEPEKKKKVRKSRSTSKSGTSTNVKRKGSKKRSVSKTRSRGSSVSDFSENEMASTPRSEISRVSFDMMDSDLEDTAKEPPASSSKKSIDGLSVERLTLLGRVHVARVSIDSLDLNDLNLSISSKKNSKSLKSGKPPRPASKTKRHNTYFIEYQFPVVATSRDKYSPNAMATEVMRVASKNIKNGVVSFNHRSVFPIMFDGTSVDKWWKSALIFKIFAREPGQKTPTAIGSCGFPLKSILRSDGLFINRSIEIRETGRSGSVVNGSARGSGSLLGNLQVSVELASDHKDFATALARTKIAEISGKTKIVPLPQPTPAPPPIVSDTIISDLENHIKNTQIVTSQPSVQQHPISDSYPSSSTNHIAQNSQPNTAPSNQISQNILPSTNQQPYINQLPSTTNQQVEDIVPNQSELRSHPNPSSTMYQLPTSRPNITVDDVEALTLNMLLFIPDGRNITIQGIPPLHMVNKRPVLIHQQQQQQLGNRDMTARNTYLVCRMFWCNDAVSSNVCWGSSQPNYNFLQIVPVLMTPSLLERMRNNFMIIEVWDKKTTAENDKLIGIIKLSLHQFFMSFRERKIANALIKSQFPVVAVDNFLPILDPFTGYQFGQIHVLLAMGSTEQVTVLQRQRIEGENSAPERPQHHLERQDLFSKEAIYKTDLQPNSVEHCFELSIEGIKNLKLFENMIWGEADCFVQYHFPTQLETDGVKHATPTLRSYRTGTTLCIPDPVFNDGNRHRITLDQGVPVQRELLTACANSSGGSGGLPFEVWCRYYHPNVRDQVIAKATLPLAKLCAMVTMQKRGEPSIQTFQLPLSHNTMTTNTDPELKTKCMDSGMLDVTLHYKTQLLKNDVNLNRPISRSINTSNVCISVGVIKAAGLKTAAEHVARFDQSMEYPSEVGVNTYIRIKLSFLQQGERLTKTVARTFAPEFSHYLDFPCPLLFTQPLADAQSLAEILESAEAVFEVWHQVPGSMGIANPSNQSDDYKPSTSNRTSDTLLGTVTLSLYSLLTKKTGINGWQPIIRPTIGWNQSVDQSEDNFLQSESSEFTGLHRVVGGLELSVRFANPEDRDHVISSGRSVGWSPIDSNLETVDWDLDGVSNKDYSKIKIGIDYICFPLNNAIVTGQTVLDRNARCYVRYKFYDKRAVISKNVTMETNDASYVVCSLNHKHQYILPKSSTYQWYLQEERLEVQVWVTYSRKDRGEKRPKQRDKLIGSAFIELEQLSRHNRSQHRISGVYPLIKPGCNKMRGSCLQLQIGIKPHHTQNGDSSDEEIDLLVSDTEQDYDSQDSFHQLTSRTGTSPSKQHDRTAGLNTENSFMVHVSIERAMHLPTVSHKDRSEEVAPTSYVSYQISDKSKPIHTDIFPSSTAPIWDHSRETRIPNTYLIQDNKNLVLKVWHKPSDAAKSPDKSSDRVLGFVSVDLSPLSSGLLQICGWYNILDFNGQCQGQMKVNITPQTNLSPQRNTDSQQINSSVPSIPLFTPWTSIYSTAIPDTSSVPSQIHLDTLSNQSQLTQQPTVTMTTQHWNPNFSFKMDNSSSKSFLFSSLRKQLDDLDSITETFKNRLGHPEPQVLTAQTSSYQNGSDEKSNGLMSESSADSHVLVNTVINSNGRSTHSAVDSGAFSIDNSKSDHSRSQDSNFSNSVPTYQSLPIITSSNVPVSNSVENSTIEITTCDSIRNNIQTLLNSHPVMTVTQALSYENQKFDAENSTGFVPRSYVPSESEFMPIDPPTARSQSKSEDVNGHLGTNENAWNSEGEESEDERVENYHRYRDILDDDDGDDLEDDEGQEVITPRAINDFSGFYAKNRDYSERGNGPRTWPQQPEQDTYDIDEQILNSIGRYTSEIDQSKSVIEIHGQDLNESQQTLPGGDDDRRDSRQPHSSAFKDSWLSDDDPECQTPTQIRHESEFHTTNQSTESHDSAANQLLSRVELIDTLTSTTERLVFNQQVMVESTENPKYHHSRNMLSRVELESVDSGTTHLPDSGSSKASRQSSAQSRNSGAAAARNEDRITTESSSLTPCSHTEERPQSESTPRSHDSVQMSHDDARMSHDQSHDDVQMSHDHDQSRDCIRMSHDQSHDDARMSHDQSHDEGVVTCRTDDLDTYISQGQNRHLIYSMSSDDSQPFQFREGLKLGSHDFPTSRTVEGYVQTEVHSDRTTDSGLESATKSSQDDKETFSMFDDTVAEKASMPNFFPDFGEMQASMKALQLATSAVGKATDTEKLTSRSANKAHAASELAAKIASKTKVTAAKTKSRQLPTADEAKRIAKIFAAKLNK
ncbi:hypothetical protein LOTGIDRAFT_165110 [Lottia gigantea]|uniref:C2 domain-containing protein n=1 Tax=Lottia gigantea TaxID=225164 RepID=V3ZEF6_LOTGI|nr:hypothetical protein LOTGIDRAFT_165110 [Lottia gigantea]ESO89518.1 hypothetical protein LOTGIDRAFT_165110 [Lottia gigantea]